MGLLSWSLRDWMCSVALHMIVVITWSAALSSPETVDAAHDGIGLVAAVGTAATKPLKATRRKTSTEERTCVMTADI